MVENQKSQEIHSIKGMIKACNKIDLIRMKIHERVREIILLKLKISAKDKNLVKRTFFTPLHFKCFSRSLFSLHTPVLSINKASLIPYLV